MVECLALRVKDIDRDRREILVRGGKGGKDRRTPLAESTVREVKQWLVYQLGRYADGFRLELCTECPPLPPSVWMSFASPALQLGRVRCPRNRVNCS